MKKIIIFIVSNILLLSNIYSQSKDKNFSGGLVASPLVISWMNPNEKNINNEGVKFGFNFGFVLDSYFNKNFAFSTGVLLTNLGGKVKFSNSIPQFHGDSTYSLSPNSEITYKLKYVEIPLSLKGISNEVSHLKYFCDFGVNPMVLYKAVGNIDPQNISGENIKNELNVFNLGYHIGLGVQFVLPGNAGLPIELIYTNGLTNISKTKTSDNQTGKIALNNIALRVGIVF